MRIIVKNILKRFIFAFAILYSIGMLLNFLNIFIPINVYTLLVVLILGFPGAVSLIMVYLLLL